MRTPKISLDDLISRESKAIAKEILQTELAKKNLPLPKDSVLDIHLDELIRVVPSIRSTAEERVSAKKDAYSEALRAIGIEPEIKTEAQVIDLDDLDDDLEGI